ncbi:hypothetical protein MUK42_25160 [Musa troglodytarum]|uniref:Uncharacterized protein n=1 Tax=Musa troglodytarum TaxID=320322 RepID=A0A9E7F8L9_9LILI|nr:hypothetical protein MUK42_25160 [Musa troglodytarum]
MLICRCRFSPSILLSAKRPPVFLTKVLYVGEAIPLYRQSPPFLLAGDPGPSSAAASSSSASGVDLGCLALRRSVRGVSFLYCDRLPR